MNTEKRFGSFSSSEDPQKLADTVKGAIISISSILIFIGAYKGITVDQAGVEAFAQQIGTTVSAVTTAIGLVWTTYGLLKKGLMKLVEKKSQ